MRPTISRALCHSFALTLGLSPLAAGADPLPDPFRATGNEPGWALVVTGGNYRLTTQAGKDIAGPASIGAEGLTISGDGVSATLTRDLCHDSMTGMPFPMTVTLDSAGQALSGCGGDPATLMAGEWTVTELAGKTPVQTATIAFAGDAVSGHSGCNRYSGAATLTGEGLSIGPVAGTRMACPAPEMEQEQTFFATLAQISRFDISPMGDLMLYAGDSVVLKARR